MDVKIPEELYLRNPGAFDALSRLRTNELRYQKWLDADLENWTLAELDALASAVEPHVAVRGGGVLLRDIRNWRKAVLGELVKARSVQQFETLLREYLRTVPGHRIYNRDTDTETHWPYYVASTKYHPPYEERGTRHPPRITAVLVYQEFSVVHQATLEMGPGTTVGYTVEEGLALEGYYAETPELREEYLRDKARWEANVGAVGKQMLACGVATDNLDGNRRAEYRWGRGSIRMDRNGEPSRVVVDVYREEKEERGSDSYFETWFWKNEEQQAKNRKIAPPKIKKPVPRKRGEDDDDYQARKKEATELTEEEVTDVSERPDPEVPIHVTIPCYDFARSLRVRVHVANLVDYPYDERLGEKLILPGEVRNLVDMLVASKGVFKDIVKGKGGGAIVLCAGPPGVGKTLTAEAYSESSKRPLFSVQCAQLGLDPKDLEKELLRVFSRAQRWNAILLLDEADVYIAARGNSLVQNAIVGVFLRVLEYYTGVLFLTTNRADTVDDAVASRCVARINYRVPPADDQRRIWRVLADAAGVAITDATIDALVRRMPTLSGRDVKNLLKLAVMVRGETDRPLDVRMVEFARQFKPTVDIVPDPAAATQAVPLSPPPVRKLSFRRTTPFRK